MIYLKLLTQIHTIIRNVDLVILDEPDKVYEAGKTIILSDFLMLAIKAYGAADERKKIVSRMTTGKDSKSTSVSVNAYRQ